MAKVGVRIEGKETLSPEAASAAKSLRKLREETEALKKGAQNILQPLINLRSTIMSVGAAAGVIQGFRAIARELGESVQEYAKIDADFGKTMAETQKVMKGFKAEIGGLVAEIAGPLMQRITDVFGSLQDNLEQARNVRNAVREATAGNLSSDAQKIEDQLEAVLKKMIEVWNESQKWYNRMSIIGTDYYDEELRQLNLVREALLRQKAALEEVAEAKALVARISATGQEAAGIVADQDAATEAVRALIRGESDLGKIIALETKLATLRASSFSNEVRYEEARLKAIELLQKELDDLTKTPEAAGSTATTEAQTWAFPSVDLMEQSLAGYPKMMLDTLFANIGTLEERPYATAGLPTSTSPLSIRDSTRGDGGLEPAGQINAFGAALQEAVGGIGGFVGGLANSVATMGPLGLLFEALKPVIEGILQVLGPALGDVLAPLLGAFVVIGQALGNALLPILQALTPVFEVLGMVVAMLVPVIDALSRPVEFVADLLGWLAQWLKYGVEQLRVFFYNLDHPFRPTTSTVAQPGGFSSDAFTRPITTVEWGELTAAGGDYLEGIGGAFGGGYGDGSAGSSGGSTTVQQMPDINVYLTIQGSVYGAGGPRKVGEEMARALEAYAGIGGRIDIAEAVT